MIIKLDDEQTVLYTGNTEKEYADYFLSYIHKVLLPAANEFFELLDKNRICLHHVYSFNAILAHSIDYMVFIAKKHNKDVKRVNFVREFDKTYFVEGSKHINNKFQLLDAVNNSFKHVELEEKRYIDLIKDYGELNFHCLCSRNGKVFLKTSNYEFDYCRVVLRPIAQIFSCDLSEIHDVDDFINGKIFGRLGYGLFDYDYESHDAIDRMIDACNPECMDCGEYSDDCDCQKFIYGNKKGGFNGDIDPKFRFEDVMSETSGTREWRKK